jgi:enterobacterial common antigen flippase
MMGAAYAVRIFVLRETGLEGAGFYQAGWTLGGLYVGFILQAMATDFYPRLVAHINDHRSSNRLVNEQARVSLLLAGPGVIATLVLAPPLTTLLYSASFANAIEVLRWICIGTALRVITWPMGYLIVAKNRQGIFIGAELAWTIVNVGLSWLLVSRYGVAGAGMAFFGSYVFHALLVYPIVRRMTGFSWTRDSARGALLFVGLAGACFLGFQTLPAAFAYPLGLLMLAASGVYSLRSLLGLVGSAGMPKSVVRVLAMCRIAT